MSPSGQRRGGGVHSAHRREPKKQRRQNPLISSRNEHSEVSEFLDSLGRIARSACNLISTAVPNMVFDKEVVLHFSDKRVNAVVCESEKCKEGLLTAVRNVWGKKTPPPPNVEFIKVELEVGRYTITVKRNALQQP